MPDITLLLGLLQRKKNAFFRDKALLDCLMHHFANAAVTKRRPLAFIKLVDRSDRSEKNAKLSDILPIGITHRNRVAKPGFPMQIWASDPFDFGRFAQCGDDLFERRL